MAGTGYPVAPLADPPGVFTPRATVDPRALPPEEQTQVEALYAELKPMATSEARSYVLARTKAEWQEAMIALVEADWPVPPAA